MPIYRLNSSGVLKKISAIYRLNNSGVLKRISAAYRLNNSGVFKKIFSFILTPIIKPANPPLLYFVDPSNFADPFIDPYSTYKMYLTRGRWTEDPTIFEMKIQRSTSSSFTSPTNLISITKTYTSYSDSDFEDEAPLLAADRPQITNALIRAGNYYRGYVKATNINDFYGEHFTPTVKPRIDASVTLTPDFGGEVGFSKTPNGATFSWSYSGFQSIVAADVFSQTLDFYPLNNTSGTPLYSQSVSPGTSTTAAPITSVVVSNTALQPNTSYTVTFTAVMNDLWKTESSSLQTLATDFGNFTTAADKPPTPTNVTGTDVGTNRPYNNGAVSLSWTQPTSSVTITGYKIEYTEGPLYEFYQVLNANTGTTTTSGTFTGLTANKNHKFKVTALSSSANSDPSADSNVVLITTVPDKPSNVSAIAGNASADVSFNLVSASNNGGKNISYYRATSTPGSITGEENISPITVTGLTNYTSYTFTVAAYNANGFSAESTASAAVTPQLPAPVGSGTVTIALNSPSNYIYQITAYGTWSNSATSYDYEWQTSSDGGTSWTTRSSGTNVATIPNYNASSYKTQKIQLLVYGRNQTGRAVSPLTSNQLTIFYTTPIINSFNVTGGELVASWTYSYTADDPGVTISIEYKLSTNSTWSSVLVPTSPGSISLPSGTYDFRLFVTNSVINGATRIDLETVNGIVVSPVYQFSFGNILYPGTNGLIGLTGGTSGSSIPTTAGSKYISIFTKDLVTSSMFHWSGGSGTTGQDTNKYVIRYDGYEYGFDENNNNKFGQTRFRVEWMATFYSDQTYVDVKIITRGSSVSTPSISPGIYRSGAFVGGPPAPTLTSGTTFRINFNSPDGSNGISYDEIQYITPNNIMLSLGGVTSGSSDDGYWTVTTARNTYNTPSISFGTPSNTSNSISIPFTESGGCDYITYDIRTGSYTGTLIEGPLNDFTSPLTNGITLSANTTYYINATPKNYKNQTGNLTQTSTTTPLAAPTASGFASSDGTATPTQPSVLTFQANTPSTNQVTTSWSNGSPITSARFQGSGAGINTDVTDSTSPFFTSDVSNYTSTGTYNATVTNTNGNLVARVSWNQSGAQSYQINYSSSVFGAETAIGNSSASSVTVDIPWSTSQGTFTFQGLTVYAQQNQQNSSTFYSTGLGGITPTAKTSTRTGSTSLTYTLPNLITNPAYGTSTSVSGGWTASISTQPNPTGGTYSVVSQTAGSASVNSSTGALTASGLTAGQSSTVTVQYNRSGYNPVNITASGTATSNVPPFNASATVSLLSGTAGRVGAVYYVSSATASGTPTPSVSGYQWKYYNLATDTWTTISGATSSQYEVTYGNTSYSDIGRTIACDVTFSNGVSPNASVISSSFTVDNPTITNVISYYYSTLSRTATRSDGYPQRPPGTNASDAWVIWYIEGYNMQGCNTRTVIAGVTQTGTTISNDKNIYPSATTVPAVTPYSYAGGIYRNTGAGAVGNTYALRIEPYALPQGTGAIGQRKLTNAVTNNSTNQSGSPVTNTLTNIASL